MELQATSVLFPTGFVTSIGSENSLYLMWKQTRAIRNIERLRAAICGGAHRLAVGSLKALWQRLFFGVS